MMKKILCVLLAFSTLCVMGQNSWVRTQLQQVQPKAAKNAVTRDQIQFWVGEGTQEVVAVFYWCEPNEGGVAYGFRFNSPATIEDMFDAIVDADPNFSYSLSGGFIESITYTNDSLSFAENAGMLMYTVNGEYANGISAQLSHNDYFELCQWCSSADCMVVEDNIYFPEGETATEPEEDATIAADQLLYWVGNGDKAVRFAVNWCDTSIALAWGVRFTGDSILVSDVMHTIELYDDRFDYSGDNGMLSNITFEEGNYNLTLVGNWWMYNINGTGAMNGYTSQYVHDGDIIKWGDESCGIADENYNYVWTTAITPVWKPTPADELYDDIVGSTGCQAIHCEDSHILGWATGCTIERGPQDIALTPIVYASYGSESDAIGAATVSSLEVVSLGDGGSATLTFDMPIMNGEGYDFAVFENAITNTFLEMAFVEVSSDGVHFYRFPSVSNTPTDEQVTNAGSVDTRHIHNLAGKYLMGWGTPFDLDELEGYSNLDINNVTHVRLVDVVGSIDPAYGTTDKNGTIINDPYPTNFNSSGFDLAGVAVLNGWEPSGIAQQMALPTFTTFPNPCADEVRIENIAQGEMIALYTISGHQLLSTQSTESSYRLNMRSFADGMYILRVGNQSVKIVKRG